MKALFSYRYNQIVILVAYTVLILLSVYHIFSPFSWDQGFFHLGAKEMSEGKILYKDFCDIKQPGIFYFFYIGGMLFSFSDVGIHLFEIIYWGIFSFALVKICLSIEIFKNKLSYYLLPLFTVGYYLVMSRVNDKTQVEILISAPIMLVAILLYKYGKTKKIIPYFIIGILISIILFFKLMYLLVIGVLILYHIFILIKEKQNLQTLLLKKVIPALLGFVIIPSIYIYSIVKNGTASIVYETFFIIPVRIKTELPILNGFTFYENLGKFITHTFPIGILSLFVIIYEIKRANKLIIMMILLIFSSLFVIFLHYSNYAYYYLILFFPMGFLSLIFLDRYKEFNLYNKKIVYSLIILFVVFILYACSVRFSVFSPRLLIVPGGTLLFFIIFHNKIIYRKILVSLLLFLTFSVPVAKFTSISFAFVSNFVLKPGASDNYKNFYNKLYITLKEESEIIQNDDSISDIFVFGEPLIYYFTNKNQTIPSGGFALEIFLDEQWVKLKRDIAKYKTKYIYIENGYYKRLQDRKIIESIESQYSILHKSNFGIWYQIKDQKNIISK